MERKVCSEKNCAAVLYVIQKKEGARYVQDSDEDVVLAVKKSNVSTGFTALNPHYHDLPNRPNNQALTEADKLLFENMLQHKTPFQVRQELLLQQSQDAAIVVPSIKLKSY